MPQQGENIEKWIERSEKLLFKDIYTLKGKTKNWVLLNSRHRQKNSDDVQIDINIDAILIPQKKAKEVLDIFNDCEEGSFGYDIENYYYLFYGEIPWGSLIQINSINEIYSGPKRISFYSPFSWFSWESYHSIMNNIENIPFLSKIICDEFKLKYDIESFAFFDDDVAVTKFYHDKFSHYLFIEENHIRDFLKKNNLSLIWSEFGNKYSNLGSKNKKHLETLNNRFSSAEILKIEE